MKVFIIGSDQQLNIIPRYKDADNFSIEIYNEDNRVVTTIDNANIVLNESQYPSLSLEFQFTCKENETFSIKVIDVDKSRILWRGKAFATSQDTQKYKINVQ